MAVVAAFLVPGTPLPYLRPENPPWRPIADGYKAAGQALASAKPDVLLIYSTQWIAVLDELWQARPRVTGIHVDENWYEYGNLPFDFRIDTELAEACVQASKSVGVKSKSVNYDGFPIDTGTIVAANFLTPGGATPLVIAANNIYHDAATTEKLAAMAVAEAAKQGKRVAVVGVGNLSGTIFRQEIDIAEDRIARSEDDAWNRKILAMIEAGKVDELKASVGEYAQEARVDMGFKHLYWILGALGGSFSRGVVHAYGPAYGSGVAVVEFKLPAA